MRGWRLPGTSAGTTSPVDHCGGWLNDVPGSEPGAPASSSASTRRPPTPRSATCSGGPNAATRRGGAASKAERADILRRVAQLYADRAAELAAIITREMGKTTAEAQGELEFTVGIYRYYADHGPELLKDEPLASNMPGTAWVRKSPIGALLGIMPWNYPYYQVARFAAPEPDDREHHRSEACAAVPGVGPGDGADLPRRGAAGGRLHQRLRHQRAGGHDDRRPAHRGRVGDRQRAGRLGGGGRGRAEPEEDRAGAGRLGPVHRAGQRRPARRWPRRPRRPGWRTAARRATRPSG